MNEFIVFSIKIYQIYKCYNAFLLLSIQAKIKAYHNKLLRDYKVRKQHASVNNNNTITDLLKLTE